MPDTQADLIRFGNAVKALNAAVETNQAFLDHCAKNPSVRHGHAPLEIGALQQTIGVSVFGQTASATARMVLGDKGFATEYVFWVAALDSAPAEVWRFYLGEPGQVAILSTDPDLAMIVCNANNLYVADAIFAGVADGIYNKLFVPQGLSVSA